MGSIGGRSIGASMSCGVSGGTGGTSGTAGRGISGSGLVGGADIEGESVNVCGPTAGFAPNVYSGLFCEADNASM
jgi:hypothetical protein